MELRRNSEHNGRDLTWQFGGQRVMSIMRDLVISMVILSLVIILWMKMHQPKPTSNPIPAGLLVWLDRSQ